MTCRFPLPSGSGSGLRHADLAGGQGVFSLRFLRSKALPLFLSVLFDSLSDSAIEVIVKIHT
jgi:hypothetical protein